MKRANSNVGPDLAQERRLARQGRIAALVIAATGVLWLLAQALATRGDLSLRYLLLVDLAALAAFFWAFVVTWRIWRARRAAGNAAGQSARTEDE